MTLPDGLYDLLLTEGLVVRLEPSHADIHALKQGAAEQLADAITRQLVSILDDMSGDEESKARRQLEIVNALLVELRHRLAAEAGEDKSGGVVDLVASPLRLLKAIQHDRQFLTPPEVGLAVPWLFTAGKGTPSLLQEIRRELASVDQVDILMSFITVSGVRKLQDVLQQITALAADGRVATRIRILTTTYGNVTEARALDELARLPGCEVRVSLDGRRTRLHAKAWLFHRKTGFGSAYVGSANLSGAALTGGLEWTVKLTQRAQVALFARAMAHFETLWEDNEFQRYDPENIDHRRALAAALGRESLWAAVGTGTGQLTSPDAGAALGLQMLAYQIDGRHDQAASHTAFSERLARHPAVCEELSELTGVLQAQLAAIRARSRVGEHTAMPACRLRRARGPYRCGLADGRASRAIPSRRFATGESQDRTAIRDAGQE